MVQILSRNRNRNRNLSKVGTATGAVKKVTVLQHCLKVYTHNIDNLNNLDIDKLDILDNHDNLNNLGKRENLNNLENFSVSVHIQYFLHYGNYCIYISVVKQVFASTVLRYYLSVDSLVFVGGSLWVIRLLLTEKKKKLLKGQSTELYSSFLRKPAPSRSLILCLFFA